MKKFAIKAVSAVLLCAGMLAFTACKEKNLDSGKTYTYHSSTSAPQTWSPTDWSMSNEDTIIAYTSSELYAFVPNKAKDGYEIIPEMASAMPVDVTQEYAGNEKYGIPSDAKEGYAWKVSIIKNAKWEDGTPITAGTFEYSVKQHLNPEMKNFRASTFYSDTLPLVNGKGYYSGSVQYDDVFNSETEEYADCDENDLWTSLTQPVAFFGESATGSYGPEGDYADCWLNDDGSSIYDALLALSEEKTYFKVTPEVKALLTKLASNFESDYPEAYLEFCSTRTEKEATPWEDVGFVKNDDYTFTLILSHKLTEFMFLYNCSSFPLVKEDLYEANKQRTGDIVKSKYGTDIDKYASFGPYKIIDYQADKSITFGKNENWYGWKDGKHKGQYQTTGIDLQFLKEHTTILNLFMQGKLDDTGLDAQDAEKYGNSDYCYITPQSYTYKFSFNIDRDSLARENTKGVVHTPLANINFRHAVSLSMNRQKWIETTDPASEPGYGLINYAYVAVPESGELYRDTEQAKQVLMEVYGTESIEDITGYDVIEAKKYFQTAYDEEKAAGYIKDSDKVQIDYHVYSASEGNQRRVSFLQDSINEATKGTGFENKVTIKLVVDENYYDNMKTGNVDLAFTAWGGSDFDPYGILWCYNTKGALNEYGFDPEKETLTINIEAKDVTLSFTEWYEALCNGEYTDSPSSLKNTILAANEKALLEHYNMIPIEYLNDLSLESQRVVEYSQKYINSLVGRGGIRYLTYTMDDKEWEDYCASQNNQLKY